MAIWVIALVVVALPPIFWALGRIDMHNDVAGWLPSDDPQARLLKWYQENFPTEDRILVSWDDSSLSDPRLQLISETLKGRPAPDGSREGGSPYVKSVSLPEGLLQKMLDSNVSFETAVDRVHGLLCGTGPLRIRLSEAAREHEDRFHQHVLETVQAVVPGPVRIVDAPLVPPPADPDIPEEDTDAWRLHDELTAWIESRPHFDLSLTWPHLHADKETLQKVQDALAGMSNRSLRTAPVEEAFFIPGSQAALTITLSDSGIEDREEALAAVKDVCLEAGVAPEHLRLGGRPVVGAELNLAVKRAGWNRAYPVWNLLHRSPILFSVMISIGLSLLMLKSMRLAILVQVVSGLTVQAAVALVPVTGGSMNMVLVVMPTLLAVLTTSAAIHLCNYWKHASARDEHGSVIEAASTAWLPCFLASCTTAIGLASLMVSQLVPVRDFGIYSAVGCIISFLMVLYLLPSLMLYWRRSPPESGELNTRIWRKLGLLLSRLKYPVVATCVLGTAACGYGLNFFRTETKVIRYFPPESRLYQDYVHLEDNLSGIISVDTIVRFSKESRDPKKSQFIDRARLVMGLQQKLRDHEEISGTLSLASFLDLRDIRTVRGMARRQLAISRRKMEERIIKKMETPGPEGASISALLALPETTTDAPGPDLPVLNEAGDELWRISAQASILSDTDLRVLTGDLDRIASDYLAEAELDGVGHVVTGLIPVFLRTQEAVLESLIQSFGLAFVLIAVVMMFLLKGIRAGLITMLPNLMPVIMIFGLLSWGHLRVDIGTMITASVALGIAVDGTLHLITWFQELIRRGQTVEEAVAGSLEHCGPAMWQTSAVIGLGMVALLPAELLLISRFGWMLAALIGAALVADIVFLPALLAGPLGTLIQKATLRSMRRKQKASPDAADDPGPLRLNPGAEPQ